MAEDTDFLDKGEQSGKVLAEKDQFFFRAEGSWEGPKPEGGCLVYTVTSELGGFVTVKHADGSEQRHPEKKRLRYAKGAKVYVCGSTMHFPKETMEPA